MTAKLTLNVMPNKRKRDGCRRADEETSQNAFWVCIVQQMQNARK
jgi:hypothetical protein